MKDIKRRVLIRRAAAALTAIGVVIAGIVIPATTASAGTIFLSACNATQCAGYDPGGPLGPTDNSPGPYGCETTSNSPKYNNIYDNQGHVLVVFANVYSGSCKSNWVYGTITQAGIAAGYQYFDLTISDQFDSPKEFMCTIGTSSNQGNLNECPTTQLVNATAGTGWTDMVDGTYVTYGSMDLYGANGNYIKTLTEDQ